MGTTEEPESESDKSDEENDDSEDSTAKKKQLRGDGDISTTKYFEVDPPLVMLDNDGHIKS
jgi:hypothetical protein